MYKVYIKNTGTWYYIHDLNIASQDLYPFVDFVIIKNDYTSWKSKILPRRYLSITIYVYPDYIKFWDNFKSFQNNYEINGTVQAQRLKPGYLPIILVKVDKDSIKTTESILPKIYMGIPIKVTKLTRL